MKCKDCGGWYFLSEYPDPADPLCKDCKAQHLIEYAKAGVVAHVGVEFPDGRKIPAGWVSIAELDEEKHALAQKGVATDSCAHNTASHDDAQHHRSPVPRHR